ncbi:MAG: hypothetical protein R3C13_02865 [Hyphomonas sp.]|uniref:TetR/AcrR family transcriptional regulator n=1 Tax=Hyphomonas sp. TaxID=87 RepID=UPI0035291A4A
MARPQGVRNHNFDEKRGALLDRLVAFALGSDLSRPSLRQMAAAVETSEPTLRHYFTDRQGVIVAILGHIGQREPFSWMVPGAPHAPPQETLRECFRMLEDGMRQGGFIRVHAFGIIEGVADPQVGQAYITHILEPALKAVRQKLSAASGGPRTEDKLQAAALAVLSPLLVLCLHQDLLGGDELTPIDGKIVTGHLEDWLSDAMTNGSLGSGAG